MFPGLEVLATKLPAWVSAAPLWGMFALVLTAFIKVWPQLKQQGIDERLKIKEGYIGRIQELERQIVECREQCDRDTKELIDEIRALQEEIYGLRKQHIQEQLSLINAITATVDAPALRPLLAALENGHRALEAKRVKTVDGPVEDKGQP